MTQSLATVASSVVGQYSQFSKLIVSTYRAGAQRMVSGANTRYVTFLNSDALPLVSADAKAGLINVQTKITDAVVGGIHTGSERAEQAIDFVAGGMNKGIERVAAAADRVEEALDTTAITKVSQVAILPVAQASLALATRAVEGTKRLSARVVGVEDKAAVVATKAKRVVKKAVVRAKTATKTVAKKARAKARV